MTALLVLAGVLLLALAAALTHGWRVLHQPDRADPLAPLLREIQTAAHPPPASVLAELAATDAPLPHDLIADLESARTPGDIA